MKTLGRLSYQIVLPILRPYLRRTNRAYVVVVASGRVLLVKTWLSRQKWQLPGGGQRRTESAAQAAVRELYEELGIELAVDQLQPATQGVWRTDRLGYPYQVLAVRLARQPVIKSRRPEILAAKWLALAELTPTNTIAEVLSTVQSVRIDKRPDKDQTGPSA